MRKHLLESEGFTLVELLVVIALLGVLTTIALGQYYKYVDNARKMVSITAMTNIRKEMENYASEHGSYPSGFNFSNCTDPGGGRIVSTMVCEVLIKEVHSLDSYVSNGIVYSLTAKARNSERTLITVTQSGVSY